MSLLFETIRAEGGKLLHLGYHNARLNRSRLALFHSEDPIDLARKIDPAHVPPTGVHRCRVEYGAQIENVTFTPYTRRLVRTLQLVDGDRIAYDHKFTDRSGIHMLRAGIRADDILMVRNGLITDTSYANIVFFDGEGWVTPASPLLPGTTRARLLDGRKITSAEIRRSDLERFSKAVLINAMLGFETEPAIEMKNIFG